jgi:hypothetical protein
MPQMNTQFPAKVGRHKALAGLAGLTAALLLSACQATTNLSEGIGFREARFQEISAMEGYRGCVDDATQLDADARAKVNPAGYLASARLIEKCEADLGPEAAHIAMEERMRTYALGIINYIKGGHLVKAQENLGQFKQAFGNHDLYLPNGASFVDTMSILSGKRAVPSSFELSMLNIDQKVETEFERLQYWKKN